MAAWVEWLLVVACGCLGQVVPRGCLCALVVRGCLPWIPQTIAHKCCPVVHMLSCAALYLEWTNMIGAQDTVGWLVCHHCLFIIVTFAVPLFSVVDSFHFRAVWILSTRLLSVTSSRSNKLAMLIARLKLATDLCILAALV